MNNRILILIFTLIIILVGSLSMTNNYLPVETTDKKITSRVSSEYLTNTQKSIGNNEYKIHIKKTEIKYNKNSKKTELLVFYKTTNKDFGGLTPLSAWTANFQVLQTLQNGKEISLPMISSSHSKYFNQQAKPINKGNTLQSMVTYEIKYPRQPVTIDVQDDVTHRFHPITINL